MAITRLERTHGVAGPGSNPLTDYFGNQRNVVAPSYDGTGLIATNSAVSAAQGGVKGNRVKLLNSPYNGEYFIVRVVSTTRFVLNATFAVAAASGQIQFGKGVLTKSTHTTGITYTSPNVLTITGGNFLTNRVNHLDLVVVDTATPAGNDGAHEVDEVNSETELIVRGSPFANGSGGNVQIQQRQGFLHIQNEASPTWTSIASAVGRPYVVERRLGLTAGGIDLRHFDLFGLSLIVFEQTSTACTWVSESEVVVLIGRIHMLWNYDHSTQNITIRLGKRGSGLLDISKGSAWIQMGSFANAGSAGSGARNRSFYGSAFFGDATAQGVAGANQVQQLAPTDDMLFALLSNMGIAVNLPIRDFAGVGMYVENGVGPLVTATPTGAMRNLNIGKTSASANIAAAVTIRGHAHGTETTKPVYTAFFNNLTLLDPQEDYPMADLATVFISGNAFKDYTFSPRIVRFLPNTKASSPIQGAVLRITEINETTTAETPVAGSPFTTDVNGRIGGGNGVALRRAQRDASLAITTFRHRIRIAANGFDPRDFVVIMRERVDQDFALAPSDFRGEEEYGL